MGVEATLAEAIGTTGVNAKYDAACKRLLSEKYILAWIMKSCLATKLICYSQASRFWGKDGPVRL